MKQLFDNDVLGTKNVRTKPEYTARKSKSSVTSFWLTLFPVLFMIAVLAFLFIQKSVLYKIADKIAPIWSSLMGSEPVEETANAEEALEVYTFANAGEIGQHGNGTIVLNNLDDHCCTCCGAFVECKDADHDHLCDYVDINGNKCAKKLSFCVNIGGGAQIILNNIDDHCCICCGNFIPCKDTDDDHYCDYEDVNGNKCTNQTSLCVDTNFDHYCDYVNCKEENGVRSHDIFCIDKNYNHICDYKDMGIEDCATLIGTCEDADFSHYCDYKEEGLREYKLALAKELILFDGPLSLLSLAKAAAEYAYAEKNSCDVYFGVHEDANLDHYCDYGCNDYFGKHVANKASNEAGEHYCDYCAALIGNCKDNDKNHLCDYGEATNGTLLEGQTECKQYFGKCEDINHDHACDYVGCKITHGAHEDKNDHKCDWCGDLMSQCMDKDKNHVCDFSGCKAPVGKCEDKLINETGLEGKDHLCDYGCGAHHGTHADIQLDHKCDYCGEELSKCADANNDLVCDICGKTFYKDWQALLMVAVPLFLICIILWIIQLAKRARVKKIRIDFYKDFIAYVDKKQKKYKDIHYRTFLGAFSTSVKFAGKKGERNNYGTVTIFCPGGPAMSMTFHNIDNPGALATYLDSKKPNESVAYNASNTDMLK